VTASAPAGTAPGGQPGKPQRQTRHAAAGFGLSQLRAAVEVAAGDRRMPLPAGVAASAVPPTSAVDDDAPPGFDPSSERPMPRVSVRTVVSQAGANAVARGSHAAPEERATSSMLRAPAGDDRASMAQRSPSASAAADIDDAPPPGFEPTHPQPPPVKRVAGQRTVSRYNGPSQACILSRAQYAQASARHALALIASLWGTSGCQTRVTPTCCLHPVPSRCSSRDVGSHAFLLGS